MSRKFDFSGENASSALFTTALGRRPDPFSGPPLMISGENSDVASNADETVWTQGGIRPLPSSETLLEAVSVDPSPIPGDPDNDTLTGTGARRIQIPGLDSSFNLVGPQIIEMNGTTPVPIPTALFRINPSEVVDAGDLLANDGIIVIRELGGGTIFEVIGKDPGGTGYGVTHSAAFTVPAKHVIAVHRVFFATDDNFRVLIVATVPVPAFGSRVQRVLPVEIRGQSQFLIDVCYPAGTDFEIRAQSTSGNAPLTITASGALLTQDSGRCP